ncbi:hypothetical protein [Streptomyces sp. NPDC058548]|uniref:hypothetical protein n=1 Tax=Streptomyces sp. NPDC058548 TaxID=3346545 RepID=UPI0036682FC3
MNLFDNPVLTAETLWRRLVEHQPAVAAALALRVRDLPQDWSQRELGVFRPEAAFSLSPSESQERVEIELYDTDWESCGACIEASDPYRYHSGFEAGYQALQRPLLDTVALDPAVTVAVALGLTDDGSTNDTGSGERPATAPCSAAGRTARRSSRSSPT